MFAFRIPSSHARSCSTLSQEPRTYQFRDETSLLSANMLGLSTADGFMSGTSSQIQFHYDYSADLFVSLFILRKLSIFFIHVLFTGVEAVKEGVDDMIKYLANEPSVGLYFVQQHAQASMPYLLDVKVWFVPFALLIPYLTNLELSFFNEWVMSTFCLMNSCSMAFAYTCMNITFFGQSDGDFYNY